MLPKALEGMKVADIRGLKLPDLVKAFRENVRLGIPCELRFTGKQIHLWTPERNGFVGICDRPKSYPKLIDPEL